MFGHDLIETLETQFVNGKLSTHHTRRDGLGSRALDSTAGKSSFLASAGLIFAKIFDYIAM
jgi:hypothetical protein